MLWSDMQDASPHSRLTAQPSLFAAATCCAILALSAPAVYDNGNVLQWTTNTAGRGTAPRRFIMQNDGNALIADANNQATWASYTAGL